MFNNFIWSRLISILVDLWALTDQNFCENHEYCLVLRVHVHITSKNNNLYMLHTQKFEVCHGTQFSLDTTLKITSQVTCQGY